MLFLVAQYWPFVILALLAGTGFGWWRASPQGRAGVRPARDDGE